MMRLFNRGPAHVTIEQGLRAIGGGHSVEGAIASIASGDDRPAERLGLEAVARRTVREFQSATDDCLRHYDRAIAECEAELKRLRDRRTGLQASSARFATIGPALQGARR